MKKSSKIVSLVLITSALASCREDSAKMTNQKVYMRADSTAQYTNTSSHVYHHNSGGNALLWYMAFRSLGNNTGYASNGLSYNSNVGHNSAKTKLFNNSSYANGGHSRSSSSYHNSSAYRSSSAHHTSSRSGFGSSSRSSVSS